MSPRLQMEYSLSTKPSFFCFQVASTTRRDILKQKKKKETFEILYFFPPVYHSRYWCLPENRFPAICLTSSNTWPHWHDLLDLGTCSVSGERLGEKRRNTSIHTSGATILHSVQLVRVWKSHSLHTSWSLHEVSVKKDRACLTFYINLRGTNIANITSKLD